MYENEIYIISISMFFIYKYQYVLLILELILKAILFLVSTTFLRYTTISLHAVTPIEPILNDALTVATHCKRRLGNLLHSI